MSCLAWSLQVSPLWDPQEWNSWPAGQVTPLKNKLVTKDAVKKSRWVKKFLTCYVRNLALGKVYFGIIQSTRDIENTKESFLGKTGLQR